MLPTVVFYEDLPEKKRFFGKSFAITKKCRIFAVRYRGVEQW